MPLARDDAEEVPSQSAGALRDPGLFVTRHTPPHELCAVWRGRINNPLADCFQLPLRWQVPARLFCPLDSHTALFPVLHHSSLSLFCFGSIHSLLSILTSSVLGRKGSKGFQHTASFTIASQYETAIPIRVASSPRASSSSASQPPLKVRCYLVLSAFGGGFRALSDFIATFLGQIVDSGVKRGLNFNIGRLDELLPAPGRTFRFGSKAADTGATTIRHFLFPIASGRRKPSGRYIRWLGQTERAEVAGRFFWKYRVHAVELPPPTLVLSFRPEPYNQLLDGSFSKHPVCRHFTTSTFPIQISQRPPNSYSDNRPRELARHGSRLCC
ncbi:hypothetical protein QBC47DRAFT_171280 [Echria macrotheca]|uniref:Uncharacterized protein n=1 Tax=Echria macrotheca TaxID=438768 RepID=A0AAJ0BJ71_9PEZI|nr:hypothetical protein QBC47DRAFT_171280 [Echria macrotheca]